MSRPCLVTSKVTQELGLGLAAGLLVWSGGGPVLGGRGTTANGVPQTCSPAFGRQRQEDQKF